MIGAPARATGVRAALAIAHLVMGAAFLLPAPLVRTLRRAA